MKTMGGRSCRSAKIIVNTTIMEVVALHAEGREKNPTVHFNIIKVIYLYSLYNFSKNCFNI